MPHCPSRRWGIGVAAGDARTRVLVREENGTSRSAQKKSGCFYLKYKNFHPFVLDEEYSLGARRRGALSDRRPFSQAFGTLHDDE